MRYSILFQLSFMFLFQMVANAASGCTAPSALPLVAGDLPAWIIDIHLDDRNYVESHLLAESGAVSRSMGTATFMDAPAHILTRLRATGPTDAQAYVIKVLGEEGAVFHVSAKDEVVVAHSMTRDAPLKELKIEACYLVVFTKTPLKRVISFVSRHSHQRTPMR